jgi:histone H3/H4
MRPAKDANSDGSCHSAAPPKAPTTKKKRRKRSIMHKLDQWPCSQNRIATTSRVQGVSRMSKEAVVMIQQCMQQAMFEIVLISKCVAASDGKKTLRGKHVELAAKAYSRFCPRELPSV